MESAYLRLKKVYEAKKINALALSKKLSRSVGSLYDIKKDPKVGISYNLAEAINKEYPDISIMWLFKGEGEMIIPEKHDPGGGVQICERCAIKDERIALLLEKIEFLERKLNDTEQKKVG